MITKNDQPPIKFINKTSFIESYEMLGSDLQIKNSSKYLVKEKDQL